MKTYIVAHRYQHGLSLIHDIKKTRPSDYQIVTDNVESLYGIGFGSQIIILETPRYKPSLRELETRCRINEILECRKDRFIVERVTLP